MYKMGEFIQQKEDEAQKFKEWVISGKGTFSWGKAEGSYRQIAILMLTRKLSTVWLKVPFLEKAET